MYEAKYLVCWYEKSLAGEVVWWTAGSGICLELLSITVS